ncbi:MAG: hypothetical protein WBH50_18385 [Fuerstiella sp.]
MLTWADTSATASPDLLRFGNTGDAKIHQIIVVLSVLRQVITVVDPAQPRIQNTGKTSHANTERFGWRFPPRPISYSMLPH